MFFVVVCFYGDIASIFFNILEGKDRSPFACCIAKRFFESIYCQIRNNYS